MYCWEIADSAPSIGASESDARWTEEQIRGLVACGTIIVAEPCVDSLHGHDDTCGFVHCPEPDLTFKYSCARLACRSEHMRSAVD